jgi:chromosome segregation ATPase
MDTIWPLLTHPFTLGLLLGLLVAAFLWKSGLAARGHLKREIKRLQDEGRDLQGHLNTQLKLNARGTDEIQKELEAIKKQNETLRVNLATLQSKPGRAEQRQYQITEAAIRAMREQAPGFAPAWEQAVRTAESEHEEAEGGLKRLVRKVIPGIATTATATAHPVDVAVAEEKSEA